MSVFEVLAEQEVAEELGVAVVMLQGWPWSPSQRDNAHA